jgi:deoxyribonuclease V
MQLHHQHPWDVTPKQAIQIQKQLAPWVETLDRLDPVTRVAGIDVGFEANGTITRAAVAVLSYPGLELVEQRLARTPTRFPYVPGLLSFREIPSVLKALEQLRQLPDLMLCDGQGLAHPRRLGIACHLGLLTDIPTIGVGKTRLIGQHGEVPKAKGGWSALVDHDQIIGAVLRTRQGVKPLYISAGHRVSLETAIAYTLACTTRYRLPETTRWAHKLASG